MPARCVWQLGRHAPTSIRHSLPGNAPIAGAVVILLLLFARRLWLLRLLGLLLPGFLPLAAGVTGENAVVAAALGARGGQQRPEVGVALWGLGRLRGGRTHRRWRQRVAVHVCHGGELHGKRPVSRQPAGLDTQAVVCLTARTPVGKLISAAHDAFVLNANFLWITPAAYTEADTGTTGKERSAAYVPQ